MSAPVPFRVHFDDGTKIVVNAPNPDLARKAAKAKNDAPITKIKRVKENA
ncbi:hypothetical protein [Mesorhizobium sp.]|nr:hypothetical protein [Mesorhizobium sp.]